ncbi:hypothetical protein Tdes44962_MAKER04261 [Teratosphaeria destructans]|uniref:DUF202 domain-containing protein n=1 Tax=Teratosphaeria destructans TaxID=418781 RepID=A0A9W7SN60_9PEZI|nr:hypothetical protein Tdes44962_MAKER04261 [Teratosphaeria destructans]
MWSRFPSSSSTYFSAPRPANTGSVARDLLASERTSLAWTRSGRGPIALGVALEKVEALALIAPTLLQLEDGNTTVQRVCGSPVAAPVSLLVRRGIPP